MHDLLIGLVGLAVSLGVAVYGYRKTLGARNERIRNANAEMERIVFHRIDSDNFELTALGVKRLIEVKARDYKVAERHLLPVIKLLDLLIARIVEYEAIPAKRRGELLDRVSALRVAAEEKPSPDIAPPTLSRYRKLFTYDPALEMVIGGAGLVAGAVTVFTLKVPDLASTEGFWAFAAELHTLIPISAAVVISSALILVILFLTRYMKSERRYDEKTVNKVIDFEKRVGDMLSKLGADAELAEAAEGFDFLLRLGKKTVLLEIKGWEQQPPIAVMKKAGQALKKAKSARRAEEAIVVTKYPVKLPAGAEGGAGIKIMTASQLKKYIAEHKT